MTEGQGERPFDAETQTRNQQEQVRASLERLCQRLAEWQADDHSDADDVTVELPDGTLKWLSELTQAEVAAGFRFRPDLQALGNRERPADLSAADPRRAEVTSSRPPPRVATRRSPGTASPSTPVSLSSHDHDGGHAWGCPRGQQRTISTSPGEPLGAGPRKAGGRPTLLSQQDAVPRPFHTWMNPAPTETARPRAASTDPVCSHQAPGEHHPQSADEERAEPKQRR